MSRRAQELLRDAAANLCRASAWLDPRRVDESDATEQALRLISTSRLMLEHIEMVLGVTQAVREETLREGSR